MRMRINKMLHSEDFKGIHVKSIKVYFRVIGEVLS